MWETLEKAQKGRVCPDVIIQHLHQCSVCDPVKITFQIQVILFFGNPTHNTKTGTGNRWETTNSKQLGPIIMGGQLEVGISRHPSGGAS
jgi:hypothetical protein